MLDIEQRPVARAEVDAVEGGQGQVAALERDGAAQNHALRRHHVGQHGKLAAAEVLQGTLPVAVVSKLCQHGCADTKRIFISTFGSTDTEHSIFNATCNSNGDHGSKPPCKSMKLRPVYIHINTDKSTL